MNIKYSRNCRKINNVLIITSTFTPPIGINATILMDAEERINQYKESLEWFINETDFHKIIMVENSGRKVSMELYYELAKSKGKKFEFLQYSINRESVIEKGKGYGEGDEIKHAIENSILLKGENYFYKVTGRVKIKNVNDILRRNKKHNNYILTKYDWMYTWFYGIKLKNFNEYFKDIYVDTNDKTIKVLEAVYFGRILHIPFWIIWWTNYKIYPQIEGQAGSSGMMYQDIWNNNNLINNAFICQIKRIQKKLKG